MIWLVILAMLFGYAIGWQSRGEILSHYKNLYLDYFYLNIELVKDRDRMKTAVVDAKAYIKRIEDVVAEFQDRENDYINLGEVS